MKRMLLTGVALLLVAGCRPHPAPPPTTTTTTTSPALVTVPCSKAELIAGTQRLVFVNGRRVCVAVP